MEKEFLTTDSMRLSFNIAGNEVNSVRKMVNTYNTLRVYDNGYIGVAGSIGEPDWHHLEQEAIEKLSDCIAYPCNLSQGNIKTLSTTKKLNQSKLLSRVRALMDKINTIAAERFVMSGGLFYSEFASTYRNTKDVTYRYDGSRVEFELILKDKRLSNLFDTAFIYAGDDLDEKGILADLAMIVAKYDVPATIDDGVYPIIQDPSFIAQAGRHLLGELYAVGASLFSGKLGQKLFNEKFSLYNDYTGERIGQCFFDDEGETGKGYIVKEGVLSGLFTTKRVSARYNLPHTAGATAEYDGIPSYGFEQSRVQSTCDSIEQAYKGKAVLVVLAQGGDMTTSGDYATPVQSSYLLQDGEIVGRLPDIKIHANLLNMLGDDYLGASNNGIFSTGLQNWVAVKMNVEN